MIQGLMKHDIAVDAEALHHAVRDIACATYNIPARAVSLSGTLNGIADTGRTSAFNHRKRMHAYARFPYGLRREWIRFWSLGLDWK